MFPKVRFCLIEKAAAATAASMPAIGQIRIHPHPTTNGSGWQDFQNIFSNNHPDFTHRFIINSIKYT